MAALMPQRCVSGLASLPFLHYPMEVKLLENALKFLFEGQSLATIKKYVQKKMRRLEKGLVSPQDLIICKENKVNSYKRPHLQPVVVACARGREADTANICLYGERVPYLVTYGARTNRLIDNVCSLYDFLYDETAFLNTKYYIKKQLIPPLSRVFGLLGEDPENWYAELSVRKKAPSTESAFSRRSLPEVSSLRARSPPRKKRVIEQYYSSKNCAVCHSFCTEEDASLCQPCRASPQKSYFCLLSAQRNVEYTRKHLYMICSRCLGEPSEQAIDQCISLDCPIFYERVKINKKVRQELPNYRHLLQKF
ncbi:hypothetical protein Zmor_012247 [Zophobas morio]|uniref:DNA-directed DNA polymerase n=1 Tax=Zophobas morio TaxID=2755281 RepID=A0AA38LYA5_9CUCU|nr:hypothetical protein Zmor_012247 [Zophobas morio]